MGERRMKHNAGWKYLLAALFVVVAGAQYVDARDLSAYVCSEGQIAVGDPISEFSVRCAAAVEVSANPVAMWVYLDTAGRQVVYFIFAEDRLQRIYTKPCLTTADAEQDPNCAQLQSVSSD